MYKVDEIILYDTEGVCKISEITEKDFGGEKQKYYILNSINKNGMTIYVPVDNEKQTAKMRKILSSEEIFKLIKNMPNEDMIWIENDSERRDIYKKIIQSGDRRDLIKLIITLHYHKDELIKQGKKLHMSDEQFMKNAERILHDEFSHVLNIRPNEVVSFIVNELKSEQTN
ncbi:CarD family transcriptional regulator [Anaerofustis stercorihominis]|uniref:CarD family transcriptional regulator n=1 Tax=Anaerofustis stercorihominis TaxID=214853 RepID=UPI00214C99B2|nr:CarD family transcriptional regulator [Anaerofustis stercorihominis]MCR2033199.1 CarD family transcriptional regulator [Anaerofustis stercorihominis]